LYGRGSTEDGEPLAERDLQAVRQYRSRSEIRVNILYSKNSQFSEFGKIMVDSKGWVVVECIVHYCGVVCLFVVSFLINRR